MPYIGKEPEHGNYQRLDSIASSFNGSTTAFNLTADSTTVYPTSPATMIISLGGVIQQPTISYTVSGGQITFTTAPAANTEFWGVSLGDTLDIGTPSDGSVTVSKMAANSVDSDQYVDGSIDNAHFADGAVDTEEIADDAVTYAKMQNLGTADRVLGSVSTGVIGEVQIVPDMLASDAITTAKILDANVTLAKIANQAANTILVRDANSSGVVSAKAVTDTQILIGDGTGFTAAALSGEATMTNAGVVSIAGNVIDEANLKSDNGPTDDHVLTAKASAAGGLTWAAASGGIASLAADTTPQLGGALDVNGQSIVSVSNGDINIIPHGTGSIALNDSGISAHLINVGGSWTGTSDGSSGFSVNPAITGAVNGSTYIARIKGTINEAGSGTHPIAIGLAVETPTIVNAGAGTTTSATFWVQGAPSGATTNYAVYIDGGTSRFDGDMEVQGVLTNAGVAKVWATFEQSGAHSYSGRPTHNMTSVTDGEAVGNTDVLWGTDFSSTYWSLVGGCEEQGYVQIAPGTHAVGGCTLITTDNANSPVDYSNPGVNFAVFGEQ